MATCEAARTIFAVEGAYDVAQVCPNGHVATSMAQHAPEFQRAYCEQCGEATIVASPICKHPIRGAYWGGGVSFEAYVPPAFCPDCGNPFPWTKRRLEAARELALDADHLSGDEKQQLADSLDDLTRDTPRTQVAADRFKRLAAKAGIETGNALRAVLVDVMSEAAKKTLGL